MQDPDLLHDTCIGNTFHSSLRPWLFSDMRSAKLVHFARKCIHMLSLNAPKCSEVQCNQSALKTALAVNKSAVTPVWLAGYLSEPGFVFSPCYVYTCGCTCRAYRPSGQVDGLLERTHVHMACCMHVT
jgi:hypothetical protein